MDEFADLMEDSSRVYNHRMAVYQLQRRCKIDGCNGKHEGLGYCNMHYQRFKIHGDPFYCDAPIRLSFSRPDQIKDFLLSKKLITSTGCWVRNGGAHDKDGYNWRVIEGKQIYMHRISACVFLGFDINSKLFVLHHCDNPSCFNPKHLFIGTIKDNQNDMERKNRRARGERNGMSKLKIKQVRIIKIELLQKILQSVIAKRHKMSRSAINHISTGKTWKHVLANDK